MSDDKECFWVEIDGIPSNYRSHHLRFFFSDFVEGDKFSLCHFYNRKSSQDGFYVVSANFPSKKLRTQFIHRYGETHWTHSEGDKILPNKCFIRSIQAKDAVER
ncbi:G patch domain containing 3, partial [Caligus rogercresseyi]